MRIVGLQPNYEEEPNLSQNNHYGFFQPPVSKKGIRVVDDAVYFRWNGDSGRMTRIPTPTSLEKYSEATVFTQKDDTDHLLGVYINALERDVASWDPGWKVLSFDHVPHSNGTYSSINLLGGQKHLAAKGSSTWMPQLLPVEYDYQRTTSEGQPIPSSTTSAGLIGSLPILVALAAFSAPKNSLVPILTRSMAHMAWERHNLPTGRKLQLLSGVCLVNIVRCSGERDGSDNIL